MHKFTEVEIDFILADIKANGVDIEDLQYNLLDHICCIIENEKSDNEDFYEFYKKIMPRFFKKDLKEIQEETEILLKFKNYYAMKNTLKITGFTITVFTILGAFLKSFHLPGAGVVIILAGGLFSLVFLPLLIILKFRDEESKTDKWVFSLGFLLAIIMTVGILFKLMHWPYANILMFSGVIAFTFTYVPLYYVTRIKRPELKFNTIVNSVLMFACGGMLFALQNLGYSSKTNNQQEIYEEYYDQKIETLENTNQELYNIIDTNKIEISVLRKYSRAIIQSIEEIKQELNTKGDDSFKDLQANLTTYNDYMDKHSLAEKKIGLSELLKKETQRKILDDILDHIQLQVLNNENSLLNKWS
ncbi:hypothetical protein [Brumimicrobium aurantiacum]|uniref:Gliding motility-associated protein GldM N-terminal domain-containing protein n=1 Tax=Brumimicrobium aurantiacum TaxID=1737063 RepID=A0A3E1EVU9_9FLAO|nr:hypothetical protein [Brumimicrobium aurantiacum]RFC53667.1 hypothetical protein DXU93_11095 [Brumimicrobium aurantiacum]